MAPYLAPRVKGAAECTDNEEGIMASIDLTRVEEIHALLEAVSTLANEANRRARNEEERQRVQDMLESADGLAEDLVTELELQVEDLKDLIRAYEQPRN
jgi:hypothetical protein